MVAIDAHKSEDMVERLILLCGEHNGGPKHHIYAARCIRKWNLGLEIRMLGAHCAVMVRKSSRMCDNLAYTRQISCRKEYIKKLPY